MRIDHALTLQPITQFDKPRVACTACASMADEDVWNTRAALTTPTPSPAPQKGEAGMRESARTELIQLAEAGWYIPGESHPIISVAADSWIKKVRRLVPLALAQSPAPDASARGKVAALRYVLPLVDRDLNDAMKVRRVNRDVMEELEGHERVLKALLAALAQPQPIAGEVYRQGLEDVANPLAYLKRKAEAQGHQLSSMAYTIAHDSNTLRKIACDALKTGMRCVNHPDRTVREVLDGEALCQECCDAWVRSEGEAARYEEQERTPASPPSDLSPSPTHDALFDEPRSGEEGL